MSRGALRLAALALLPAGWLADRFGRRRAVLLVWLVGGLGTFAMLPASRWQGLLPGSFLMLCGAAGVPSLAALAAETVPPDALRRSMNAVFAAAPLGLLVGSTPAGTEPQPKPPAETEQRRPGKLPWRC